MTTCPYVNESQTTCEVCKENDRLEAEIERWMELANKLQDQLDDPSLCGTGADDEDCEGIRDQALEEAARVVKTGYYNGHEVKAAIRALKSSLSGADQETEK